MPAKTSHRRANRNVPPYHEGAVFVVPLRDGGFAQGVVARAAVRGKIVLGYFFGPRLDSIQDARANSRLHSGDAILIARFGDVALLRGTWEVIGEMRAWRRDEWPTVPFIRRDALTGAASKIEYDDDDPALERDVCPADDWETAAYFPDGMNGFGAVEIKLTNLLGNSGIA